MMCVRSYGDEHERIALATDSCDHGAKSQHEFRKVFHLKILGGCACKYAGRSRCVAFHAAGKDAKKIDSSDNYPNPDSFDKGIAKNFITVGASGDPTNGGFTASFSNYGKRTVDIFAPGVNIYSTLPGGNVYGKLSGTSMAAPVVAGVAALIREYFPDLSAEQVKYVLEKSAQPVEEKVILPGTQGDDPVMVNLSDLCRSGGEVNAYNAVKLALTMKGEKKK